MNRKIMLLALAAVSATAFAMPSAASATLLPLHMSPTPTHIDINGVGPATFRSSAGTFICGGVKGTATPEAGGTTGTLTLTIGADCTMGGLTCTSTNPAEPPGNISSTPLPYHLVTIDNENKVPTVGTAGMLVTPGANGVFFHILCGGFIPVAIKGNGLLGTITSPACGGTSTSATLSFQALNATTTQKHRFTEGETVAKTTGPWSLEVNGAAASLEAHMTLTFTNSTGGHVNSTLSCT